MLVVEARGDSTGAVLGQGDMLVWCFWSDSAENWIFCSCFSSLVVDIPVLVQRPIPMVLLFSRPSDSAVAVRCQVVDALITHVVLDMPVAVQRQVLMVR